MRTLSILSIIVGLAVGVGACKLDVGEEGIPNVNSPDSGSEDSDDGSDERDPSLEEPERTPPKPVDRGKGGAGGMETPAAGGGNEAKPEPHTEDELQQPSKGSAIVLSEDDSVAVAVNRDSGSVTVLGLEYSESGGAPKTRIIKEVLVGEGSEPYQAVIGPDGDTAYVVLRKDQKLVKIEKLHTAPAIYGYAETGSEPTSLALSPSGRYVYVTNWQDGTIGEYSTSELELTSTIDLNAALVKTGYLGKVKARPALAHPRSIVITNDYDGYDSDETLFVTEYFGQQVEAELADGSNSDFRKVGIVYYVPLETREARTINLKALKDIGFLDNAGVAAGCYPNQLQSIALNGNYAYVMSVCASPKGPLGVKVTTTSCSVVEDCNGLGLVEPACVTPFGGAPNAVCVDTSSVKTSTAPVMSIIDTRNYTEVQDSAKNLNALFATLYAAKKTPDAQQRFPLFAGDIAFVSGTNVGYVTADGADAVFRFTIDNENGRIKEVGASTNLFIDLLNGFAADKIGKSPIGIAIASSIKKLALVSNEVSRNVSVLDFNTQAVLGGTAAAQVVQISALPATGSEADKVLRGKRFFKTGTGRWSLKGQGWGACQSCHGDALSDNVTWYFARGPRQSTSLEGSFGSKNGDDQRIFNWTAIFDNVDDFEGNTRDVSGGVGAIVSTVSNPAVTTDRLDFAGLGHAGLNGSSEDLANPANPLGLAVPGKLADWDEITVYLKTIRTPRAPTNLDSKKVELGRDLFTTYGSCQGCHGGEKWTVSRRFYTPSIETNNLLKTAPLAIPDGFPTALLPALQPQNQVLRFGGPNAAAFDQILCVIRPVDTFNVAEDGVGIAELRADMKTVAQGDGDPQGEGRGYNVPSLLGMGTGAPYLHGGNARTLEALFSSTFETHTNALAPNFLAYSDPAELEKNVEWLVQYILSIDEDTKYPELPKPGAAGGSLCPDVFPAPAPSNPTMY